MAYSLAFLDRYVRDRPAAPVLTSARPGVASLRFEEGAARGGEPTR